MKYVLVYDGGALAGQIYGNTIFNTRDDAIRGMAQVMTDTTAVVTYQGIVFACEDKELSNAYVRLRTLIPGALDTPYAPTPEQVWETTERALKNLVDKVMSPAPFIMADGAKLKQEWEKTNRDAPGYIVWRKHPDAAPIFDQDQWTALVNETMASLNKLSATKGREYARDDVDELANFRRAAADCGLQMEQVWRVYAGKHWDSISQFVKDLGAGKDRELSEPMAGRADDLILYLILFKAMLIERGIK